MKKIKVGLNGFGRIGRAFTRIAFQRNSFEIVAVNTRKTPPKMLAYLLKYDSVYKSFNQAVSYDEEGIIVNNNKIYANQISNPEEIPWEKYDVDLVLEATGAFTKMDDLKKHLKGTVKKVILSAPSKDEETPHVVLGVNEDQCDLPNSPIISNASCTTNSASPLFLVLDKNFKILKGFLTTIHAYTSSQKLLDDSAKKFTRARAAALNIIPTTTGAAKAVVKTLPHLKGKIDGMAVRVPVPTGSFTQISALVEKPTSVEKVNQALKQGSETYLKGILGYEEMPLVSSDHIGSSCSSIFDPNYTKVIDNNLIQIFSWYDNEWGYSERLADLVEKMSQHI